MSRAAASTCWARSAPVLYVNATSWPWRAASMTIASPMPREPPVTKKIISLAPGETALVGVGLTQDGDRVDAAEAEGVLHAVADLEVLRLARADVEIHLGVHLVDV